MRINRVEIRKLALPMKYGFNISSGEVTHKKTVIIKLYSDDGFIGYGESTTFNIPNFTNESNEDVINAQRNIIAPRIIGKHFETPEELIKSYQDITGNYAAKCGIECAFWHLISIAENKSLSSIFGGTQNRIPVGESIGLKPTVIETLEEIKVRLKEGYQRIKVKIRPGWDIELVKVVRQKWPVIDLSIDANSAYNYIQHKDIFLSLDNYNLSTIEQPFGSKEIPDHAKLQNKIKTPISLDESIQNMNDLKYALKLGACKFVNIKPVRVGGIVESIKMHDFAAANGVGVYCGGMLETGIGRAFNIALASKTNFIYPSDMSPYQVFYAEDLIDPSYVISPDGYIEVPISPGIGYKIRDDLIEKYTIEKFVV